ncbi:MAG: hypothetical protein ACOC1F_03040 [Myxococcota bacterium]
MNKPPTAAGYTPEFTSKVRATCLYGATKLGDLMDDTVVIGGLVPSLIIDAPGDAHLLAATPTNGWNTTRGSSARLVSSVPRTMESWNKPMAWLLG